MMKKEYQFFVYSCFVRFVVRNDLRGYYLVYQSARPERMCPFPYKEEKQKPSSQRK